MQRCAAATNAAVQQELHQQQSLADLHAPEATYLVKSAPAKKRGAVIGSAAKLSSEGLMAAAKLAKEKEERRRAQVQIFLSISMPMCSMTALCQHMNVKEGDPFSLPDQEHDKVCPGKQSAKGCTSESM